MKVSLTESAVELIKTIVISRGTPDPETGLLKTEKYGWVRALNICNIIAKANKHGHVYFSKDKSFRDSCLNYTKLNDIIQDLQDLGILSLVDGQYRIVSDMIGECDLDLERKELSLLERIQRKPFVRGNKATADAEFCINISESEFRKLMLEREKLDDITDQWNTICEINSYGTLSPKRKRKSRLSSRFSTLSSCIHPYITMNGKSVVSLDQHATYTTILPIALLNVRERMQDESYSELLDLIKFISCTPDLYCKISEDTGISRTDAKLEMNSFICDPFVYQMKGIKGIIQSWFMSKWPNLNSVLNRNRETKFIISKLMEMESAIFVGGAAKLNQAGIPCFTKHDAIFFYPEHRSVVESEITGRMAKLNISAKLNYSGTSLVSDSAELRFAPLSSFKEIEFVGPRVHEFRTNGGGREGEAIVYGIAGISPTLGPKMIKKEDTLGPKMIKKEDTLGPKEDTLGPKEDTLGPKMIKKEDTLGPKEDTLRCSIKITECVKRGVKYWRFQIWKKLDIKISQSKMTKEQFMDHIKLKMESGAVAEPTESETKELDKDCQAIVPSEDMPKQSYWKSRLTLPSDSKELISTIPEAKKPVSMRYADLLDLKISSHKPKEELEFKTEYDMILENYKKRNV